MVCSRGGEPYTGVHSNAFWIRITQSNPLRGIDQLVDGDVLLAEYLEMLKKRPTDIRMLAGLDIVKERLTAHEPVKEEDAFAVKG